MSQHQIKQVAWDWELLTSYDDSLLKPVFLSARDLSFLMTPMAVAEWRTRWLKPASVSFDTIDAYTASVIERLSVSVDLCALVADCITNDEGVQNALNQVVSAITAQNTGSGNRGSRGDSYSVVECNDDRLYGGIVAAIQTIDRAVTDVLEVIAAQTNFFERMAEFVEAFPIVGSIPLDDVLNLVSIYADTALEQYVAAYTAAVETDIACAIWCLIEDNGDCVFNTDIMLQAYLNLASITFPGTLFELWDLLVEGTYTGPNLVYALHAATISPAVFENWLVGSAGNAQTVLTSFENGAQNAPDSGWDDCDCPSGEVVLCWEWSQEAGNFQGWLQFTTERCGTGYRFVDEIGYHFSGDYGTYITFPRMRITRVVANGVNWSAQKQLWFYVAELTEPPPNIDNLDVLFVTQSPPQDRSVDATGTMLLMRTCQGNSPFRIQSLCIYGELV